MFARSRSRCFATRLLLACALSALAPGVCSALTGDVGLPEDPVSGNAVPLTSAANRRAEAMARVAAGLIAEDDNLDDALRHYQRALDLDPSNAPLARQVAGILLHRGEAPEALAVLKDASKRRPESAVLALQIAEVYAVSLRKFDLAQRYAERALQQEPDLIEPYQLLYGIHRATGHLDDAAALLQRATERKNQDPEFWAGLGDLFLRQSLMTDGKEARTASVSALAHYRQAVKLGWQNASVLLRALNFFAAGGYGEDAVSCGRRLLILQPSDSVSREKLALALISLGRDDEALVELDAVVVENPASPAAYRAQGEILLRRGDRRAAADKFEKALVLFDEDPQLYLELADLYLQTGEIERAIRWLGEARTRFDRLPELPYYEGLLLSRLQRWHEALQAFNLSADLAAKYQPAFLTPEFHFQRGMASERTGKYDEAVRDLRSCLALDPDHADALNYLGYMWAERGENLAEAESFIRRALQREPDNPAFLDSLGWVLHQQGRYHEALPPLERASKTIAQPDAAIEEHIGDVLEKLGRKQDAVKAWERAVSLGDASPKLAAKLQSARKDSATPGGTAESPKP